MASVRLLTRSLLAATLLSLVFAPAGSAAVAPAWPQASSDIPADPAVTFGALENGMRYAIMKNTTPKGEVSLRLRIGTGSLQESDAQQGLAHFLEHMAFRGSTHVPEGDVFQILQRLGLRTGADTNASTGQTETIYQLDLPRTDDQTLDTGFMLARDIVSELTLNPTAMDTERGPVLSEERLRDGPGYHAFVAQTKFLLKGQLASDRSPIGKVEVIRNAPVTEMADYYRAYYRPERTALVIVGDIDPAAMEARIKAKFSDWQPTGEGRADPNLGTPPTRGQEALVFVEANAPQAISVDWIGPYDNSPDTAAQRKKNRIEGIGFAILNQRFNQASQAADAPFLNAGASRGNTSRSAKITGFRVSYAADNWQRALEEAVKIRRQVLTQGVTQPEVDRQIANALAGAQSGVAAASTRNSRALAGGLIGSIDRDSVFNAPETGLKLIEADLKGVTADTVNAALRAAFTGGNGPFLFLSSPKPVEGGEMTLASVFARAEAAPIDTAAPPQLAEWPYTDFGTPGTVVESRKLEDLDTTFIRFTNGVKLTVKPTKYSANQILIDVSFAGGELAMPKDRVVISPSSVLTGGVEAMTSLDMRRTLTGKIYSASFGVGDDSFSLSGGTRPADLDTQMQVLAAYVTKPGWRSEIYQQGLKSMADGLAKIDATPMSLFGAKLSGYLHSNDLRWTTPAVDDVEKARFDDVRNLIGPVLANSPIEVTMVGDVTVEQATNAVAKTFGALPPRSGNRLQATPGEVRFPAPNATPTVLNHAGRADQGVSAIAWQTTDVFADEQSGARRLLTDIVQMRLMEQLRIADGATYSPQTSASASLTFPGYGYIFAYAELPPEKSKLFYDTVAKITADLREHAPEADEFERARRPELDGLERSMQTNAFWMSGLIGAQSDERRLKLVRDARSRIEKTTPADVQRVAQKYLTDEKAWRLVIAPKP